MKRLYTHSQHFLRNPRFVGELIGHTSIKRSDTVIDIGAGSGVITSVLAKRARHVIAIEPEPETVLILKRNMAIYSNVTVVKTDFMNLRLPEGPYKIFANIPFHLSTAIVNKFTSDNNPPSHAYIIVQKQFANKLLTDYSGFTSQLGIVLGIRYQIRIRRKLKRTDFWPHPNVDTVFLEIAKRDSPLIPLTLIPSFEQFVRSHFTDAKRFKKVIETNFKETHATKPSQLTVSEWVRLFESLFPKSAHDLTAL